jgi:cellulose synthase/poly-beta-1,6-N-acetylglucosamine synthase-like glycosyltransferase
MTQETLYRITSTAFYLLFGYFLMLLAYYAFLTTVGFAETRRRWQQNIIDDYPLLYFSSFTLPISVIIPARNEEEWIRDTVLSVTNLNYPEFEIIVVDDGSTDRTLEVLNETLALKEVRAHYVKHFKDGIVQKILKSEKYPNVTVISKSAGMKKAGAVNAGLNIAKYKYICAIDADTLLEPDGLLKVMAQIEKEPNEVIGIGSYFGLINGFKIKDGRIIDYSFSFNPILAYQNLEYIRSFFGNRIAWSKFNATPNVAGGFGLWRRDILYELGGYSADFTCEDIEMTFRVHDYLTRKKYKNYKILTMPYYAGWTEGPSNIKSLISQRDRWQRVTNETIWKYKHMLFNPAYKWLGLLTLPYFLLYEVFGVFIEVISLLLICAGALAGILDVQVFLAYFCLMLLSQAFISAMSLFAFVRDQKVFRLKYMLYLLFLSMVESFWYRWIISFAKLLGMVRTLLNQRSFDQYVREKRVKKS